MLIFVIKLLCPFSSSLFPLFVEASTLPMYMCTCSLLVSPVPHSSSRYEVSIDGPKKQPTFTYTRTQLAHVQSQIALPTYCCFPASCFSAPKQVKLRVTDRRAQNHAYSLPHPVPLSIFFSNIFCAVVPMPFISNFLLCSIPPFDLSWQVSSSPQRQRLPHFHSHSGGYFHGRRCFCPSSSFHVAPMIPHGSSWQGNRAIIKPLMHIFGIYIRGGLDSDGSVTGGII